MLRSKVRKRLDKIFICCCLIFLCIIGKLGYEQMIHHEFILDKAKSLWERDFHITGLRGNIVDKNHKILAMDIPSTSVVVVPAQIKEPDKTAEILSELLKCEKDVLYQKITKKVSTQKLQPEGRLIETNVANKIEELDLKGVYLVQDSLRYYPRGNYLAQVLGFTGIDNQGLSGIELQYESFLSANKGSLKIPFDAKGHDIELYQETYEAPGKGMDVMLTIDCFIQDVLERELNIAMQRYEPDSAMALAMNPNTGEILGMVSKPDFDPNHYQNYNSELINRNLPIWMNFEPGSTFKSVTFSSALDLNLFDMFKDTYFDKGFEMVEGARIKSWRAGGHGQQTYLQVLENSSNPGFVNIGRKLGLDNLYAYVKAFGFGSKTGIDLPGESTGIMFAKEAMGPIEQATVAFGQGLSTTPIQLVRAFSAIVNGGILYEPYITKAFLDPITNEPIASVLPKKTAQVIKKETSEKMKYALESVVANGGGKASYISGYKIGGKTGTAQKVKNGVYSSNEYILSFLSAAPIDKPEIVIYMALDSPKNDIQYGGSVVAPIVRNCYMDILPYFEVKKVNEQIPKKKLWLDPVDVTVDNYIGKKIKDIKETNIIFETIGNGEIVVDQLPKKGTKIKEGGTVWLYLEKDET